MSTSNTISRFNTLLLREWMQHHRGWLAMVLLPPLIVLALLPFGSVEIGPGELGRVPELAAMLAAMALVPAVVLGITVFSLLIQAPGLARRDVQDRSIEFWLSLPVSHSSSIGATVLMHLVLVPLFAVVVGAVLGVPIGIALVWKGFGMDAALGLPWGPLAAAGAAGLARAMLGVVLACLWLVPLVLSAMAASAWLKRWGVPLLGLVLGIGHAAMRARYDNPVIGDTLRDFFVNARLAIVGSPPPTRGGLAELVTSLGDAPGWFLADGLDALKNLGQPLFGVALVVGAAAFGLLVLRRSRSG
jgi:ABC-2 type transport system permease protein